MYLLENQMGENPHDKTDPRVSTAILTEHTRDGVELARKHRLPEPIIDMIRQHHGTRDTPAMRQNTPMALVWPGELWMSFGVCRRRRGGYRLHLRRRQTWLRRPLIELSNPKSDDGGRR